MKKKTEAEKITGWMKRRFMPECAAGWDSTIHVFFSGGEMISMNISRRKPVFSTRPDGEPLATIRTDADTFLSALKGDMPLDVAVMTEKLATDNMIETFKFISVFKPDSRKTVKLPRGRSK